MARLLLIEDNASNQKLITGVLRRAGHALDVACSADEGIPMAITGGYDLIVMDIQLPGTDGLTATRLLRGNAATQHVPILAVTAFAMRGDERRIREAGCDGYVSKPIAYKPLIAEVARLLGSDSAMTRADTTDQEDH